MNNICLAERLRHESHDTKFVYPNDRKHIYLFICSDQNWQQAIRVHQHSLLLAVINIETDIVMPEKSRNDRQQANNIFGTTTKQFAEVERVF
ncbi:unnamed protein product, partial [Onchocerca ochengi]|uniref:Helitron_like_N domain-containing protein n=1 Tax=Onchocerca ochengi TaxID=42157 RepID=A0A182ENV8_ONCOC